MPLRTPADYRGAIRKIQRLYSTPQVLARAIHLMNRPDVNLESISELIRHDSALVADIIRLSNSALFNRGTGCSDLYMAVQRLGLREVIRAINLSLSRHVFGKGLTNYGLEATQYWRASLLGALLMEHLANIHGVDSPECYTVGILHAMGRVLINEALGETDACQPWDRSTSIEKWEVDRVGFTSAEAGALLLRQWGFPPTIVNPIENQLGPPTIVSAQSPTGMLRLTRLLLTLDPEVTTAPQPATFAPDLLGWAGFACEEEPAEILSEARRKVDEIVSSMTAEVEKEGVPEGL